MLVTFRVDFFSLFCCSTLVFIIEKKKVNSSHFIQYSLRTSTSKWIEANQQVESASMALAFYSLDCWWIFSLRIARFKLAFISLQSARQIFCREVFCAGKSARESIANWIERQSEMSFSLYYSYTIKNFVKCFSNRITLRWHIQFQFVVVKTNWNTMLGFLTCSKVFEVLFIWTYHNFDILNNMNTTAKKMRQISGWYGFFFLVLSTSFL